MATFDRDTLQRLHDLQEIAIRTGKHPDKAVTIWVAVAGECVFVRSVRGPKGQWYKDLARGGTAELDFAGHRVAVQATPTDDKAEIDQASQEYLRKYRTSPYAQSMVRADALPTTLRLEPR